MGGDDGEVSEINGIIKHKHQPAVLISYPNLFNSLVKPQVLSTFHQKFVLLFVIPSDSDPLWFSDRTHHQYLRIRRVTSPHHNTGLLNHHPLSLPPC